MCIYSFPQKNDTECLLNFDFQKKSSYSKERDMENNVRENKFGKKICNLFLNTVHLFNHVRLFLLMET